LHNYVSKSLQYKDGYSVIVINYWLLLRLWSQKIEVSVLLLK
jgi:hypothetical protein